MGVVAIRTYVYVSNIMLLSAPKVPVHIGDTVQFRWTPDNAFYSKSCTQYGVAIDQFGNSDVFKIAITCSTKEGVKFIAIMVHREDILDSIPQFDPEDPEDTEL